MSNWAADWLERNPDLAGKVLTRHRHGITAQLNASERVSHFVGSPAHYLANGVWQPLDTALQLIGAEYGAPGLPTRIALDGGVRIDGQAHGHRSTRIGLFRPATKEFIAHKTIPNGHIDGDRMIAENGILSRVITLTERGLREEVIIAEKPSIPGVKLTDWLVLETAISGSAFADGWLDEFETSGVRFPLPSAHDSSVGRVNAAECKRYARTIGGVQYVYTGVPVSWLADASYPVTIDPDYAADNGDGFVEGENRTTSNAYDTTLTYMWCGQDSAFWDRAFLKFSTSAIPDGDAISQVNLKMTCVHDYSATDFDVQIVKQDWSGQDALSAANREAAFDGCLAGTADSNIWRNTNGMNTNTQYTSGNLATDWPSKTGYTYYSLRSSLDYANNPAASAVIGLATQDYATSSYRPLLAITHAAAGGSIPVIMRSYRQRKL